MSRTILAAAFVFAGLDSYFFFMLIHNLWGRVARATLTELIVGWAFLLWSLFHSWMNKFESVRAVAFSYVALGFALVVLLRYAA